MWSPSDASPDQLRLVAEEIEASGRWIGFITPQEHALFILALRHSPQTWSSFLKGAIPCQLRFQGNEEEEAVNEDVDSISLAFKVRYMLWESQIDNFFDVSKEPFKLINSSEKSEPDSTNSHGNEDYDFDYDEKEETVDSPLEKLVIDTNHEESEPTSQARNLVIQNSLKMYDTFDGDIDQVKRFMRLKKSEAPVESAKDSGTELAVLDTDNMQQNQQNLSLATFAKAAQFGSANLCLKHLLTTIDTHRQEMNVTDVELRNLISDVRKNRSKWASEDRIGQEELYEACERVVQELRGYTEHSTAFLNKVSKREAPNYYDIIKNPMDLNSVMRKIRSLQYNSKNEFVNDLNLIWSNCLLYNSDPAHYLRKHAIAMRQKTQTLTPLIPDIIIRSRSEVEAEAEAEEKLAREKRRRGSDEGGKHSMKRRGVNKVPAQNDINGPEVPNDLSDFNNDAKEESEQPKEYIEGSENEGNVQENSKEGDSEAQDPQNTLKSPNEVLQDPESDSDSEETYTVDEREYAPKDVETRLWNSVTRNRRLACITQRNALFTDNHLQMDAEITPRTPGLMMRFEKTLKGEEASTQLTGMSLLSNDNNDDPFMIEYEVNSGLPPSPPGDPSWWAHTTSVPKLNELPPSRYVPVGSTNKFIMQNLNEMQKIRRLCNKILYIRDLQGGQMTMDFGLLPSDGIIAPPPLPTTNSGTGSLTTTVSGECRDIRDPEEDISSRLPGAATLDRHAAISGFRKVVSKLAMAAGFEAVQPSTIDCLASIAGDHLERLGSLIMSNLEAPSSTLGFSEILTGSLETIGVEKLSHLTNYISDDILRQGRRLATFRSRLNSTLVEILRPEVEKYQDEQFNDNSDQFVLGQFSNELGDDYFGFKELGIDKELGVSDIAIPFHLLQQRIADSRAGVSRNGKLREQDLPVPEYPPLLPSQIIQLPIFLQPKFEQIFSKYKVANDEAPNESHIAQIASQISLARAKVPASGKLAVRKKKFENAFFIPIQEQFPDPDSLDLKEENMDQLVDQALAMPANNSLFDEDEEVVSPSIFTFDDNLPTTGSLLMHAEEDNGDDEDEDNGVDELTLS